MTETISKHICE
jgi:hypothetical protein